MKYLFILLLTTLALACGNNGTGPADGTTPVDQLRSTAEFTDVPGQDTARYRPLYLHKIPPADEIKNATTSLGGFGMVLKPELAHPVAQMLVKSLWVVEGYADSDANRNQRIGGVGQWIQCFDNGTFFGGHWGEQTHSGAWYIDTRGEYPRITLDSNVDRLDAIWEVQGYSGDGSSMAVVRKWDTKFGPYRGSLAAKWIELYDRPTKDQFKGLYQF